MLQLVFLFLAFVCIIVGSFAHEACCLCELCLQCGILIHSVILRMYNTPVHFVNASNVIYIVYTCVHLVYMSVVYLLYMAYCSMLWAYLFLAHIYQ